MILLVQGDLDEMPAFCDMSLWQALVSSWLRGTLSSCRVVVGIRDNVGNTYGTIEGNEHITPFRYYNNSNCKNLYSQGEDGPYHNPLGMWRDDC